MKKTAILLLAFITLSSLSCDKEYKFYGFDINETIELNFNEGDLTIDTTQNLDINMALLIEENYSSLDKIEKITIESVSFSLTEYYYLDAIVFMLDADGQNPVLLADNSSIDMGSAVKLNVSDEDLIDYFKSSNITVSTLASMAFPLEELFVLTANLRFRVFTYVK